MQIPDEIKKCVVFLAAKKGDEYQLKGTGFMVGYPVDGIPNSGIPYLVTARHVVDEIEKAHSIDSHVYVRINPAVGDAQIGQIPIDLWFRHSDDRVDVAVAPAQITSPHWDHLLIPSSMFLTDATIQSEGVGVGDDLFFPGLFVGREGESRNIPIVRVGNIAAMPGERIKTKLGNMHGYLVEARSIGGLSGSPVFVHLGSTRKRPGGQVVMMSSPERFFLLGMIHGHYGLDGELADMLNDADFGGIGKRATVNMGIGIVCQMSEIVESLEHPDLVKQRQDIKERWDKEQTNRVPETDGA